VLDWIKTKMLSYFSSIQTARVLSRCHSCHNAMPPLSIGHLDGEARTQSATLARSRRD
jgi:hypothetical protein